MSRRPGGRRTALIFHSTTMSGSARSFKQRLRDTVPVDERFILVPGDGPLAQSYDGVGRVLLFGHSTIAVPSGLIGALRAGFSFVRDVARFARFFRAEQLDVVVCSSTYIPAAYITARFFGLVTVVYCGEILVQTSDRDRRAKRLVATMLAGVIPRVADLVICCSRQVERQFLHTKRARVVSVYPSIDTSRIGGTGDTFARSEGPLIVAVGSLTEGRGQQDAITALALVRRRCPSAVLALAGLPGIGKDDEAYGESLRAYVRELNLGDAVQFLGHVEESRALMRDADVVINPARFDEPFGRVPYEALSVGTPVVVTATGASTEVLTPEEHLLAVEPSNPPDLASAILRLLEDSDLGHRLVAQAQPILGTVAAETGNAQYRTYFDELLANTAPSEAHLKY